jgi:toxin HigB-1
MIESFKNKALRLYFETGDFSRIKSDHRKRVKLILTLLQAATVIGDINFPGSDLHPLKGELKEFWSVKISGNWRIIFRFDRGKVYDVDYIDYH